MASTLPFWTSTSFLFTVLQLGRFLKPYPTGSQRRSSPKSRMLIASKMPSLADSDSFTHALLSRPERSAPKKMAAKSFILQAGSRAIFSAQAPARKRKQTERTCRAWEFSRSQAQENNPRKRGGLPDSVRTVREPGTGANAREPSEGTRVLGRDCQRLWRLTAEPAPPNQAASWVPRIPLHGRAPRLSSFSFPSKAGSYRSYHPWLRPGSGAKSRRSEGPDNNQTRPSSG
jgi:hypothetical protein